MRNKLILIVWTILLISCQDSNTPPSYLSFKKKYGLLYFQYPQSGSTITCFFFPYSNQVDSVQNTKKPSALLDHEFDSGIQFSVSGPYYYSKFSQAKYYTNLRHDASIKVHFIPNVKIDYFIEKSMYNENDVMSKDVQFDIISFAHKTIRVKYYYSYITIDSLYIKSP